MTFREDGAAALEWAARYLEQVGEFPVLAQVEPGDIRSRLPASPPEQGEPFADVLRDLDEILLPGTTHWQPAQPISLAFWRDAAAQGFIRAAIRCARVAGDAMRYCPLGSSALAGSSGMIASRLASVLPLRVVTMTSPVRNFGKPGSGSIS